jgi:SAM-dependent methyltransferase
MGNQIVKTDFDFGWRKWKSVPPYIELAFRYQKGDILDIGCGTCQLYNFLKSKGWKGKYYGIDIKKYGNYDYSEDIEFIIGNALELELPKVNTAILYNVLEHIDDPIGLLAKALDSSKDNVLINVPKRNEEMWQYGIAEYHQIDKSHRHCGFSKKEVYKLVNLAGGKIVTYKELGKIDAKIGMPFWNNIVPKAIVYLLDKIFSSKTFYQEIWCEVIKK